MQPEESLDVTQSGTDGEEPAASEFRSPAALQALLLAIELLQRETARPVETA